MTKQQLLDIIRARRVIYKDQADRETNAIDHAGFRAREFELIYIEAQVEQLENTK